MRKKPLKGRVLLYSILGLFTYAGLTIIFGAPIIFKVSDKWPAFVDQLGVLWWFKLILVAFLIFSIEVLKKGPLDIKDKTVGSGQHGDAHPMDEEERAETYLKVPFGKEKVPGFVVSVEDGHWTVDNSKQNMMLLAPPDAGKTTGEYVPTITYNALVNKNTAGKGSSLILVDIKGTLYETCAAELQAKGYRTPVLNLREVFRSYPYNILYRVNAEIDHYLLATTSKERVIYYGRAERYAKIVASSIVDSMDAKHTSEGSQYFNESAKGLIISLILLVSEYAPAKARHIMSVFNLIIEMNGQDVPPGQKVPKSKLAAMLENINNKRAQDYAGAAMGADIRTVLNVISSALAKLTQFVDAELEQLMCSHTHEFDAQEFVDHPTAVFIICPDENPTRHFLASLFIRFLTNDLIDLAETQYKGVLPRNFLLLMDEFGNFPAIPYAASLFSAIRSRGGRVLCALQSYAQLLDHYSEHKANIIRDTCQMLMFSFVAPSAESTANTISKMLGNETVQSGSRSMTRGVITSSIQMIGRPLLAVDELVTLPQGTFITMKGGHNPYYGKLPGYWKYLKLEKNLANPVPELDYQDVALVTSEYLAMAASGLIIKLKRGMYGG